MTRGAAPGDSSRRVVTRTQSEARRQLGGEVRRHSRAATSMSSWPPRATMSGAGGARGLSRRSDCSRFVMFKAGRFLREDWTACTAIGRATSHGVLTKEQYLLVEELYVGAVMVLARAVASASLQAHGVEFWEHGTSTLANLGLGDVFDGSAAPDEGEQVTGNQLENLVRRCLREVAWLELMVKPTLLIHFGYDMRLVVASNLPLAGALDQVRASGLFIYDSQASLPTLDAWPSND
jgi:hypothetical protein